MGKRVNLFSEKRKVKKVDDKAFDMMTAVSDKTDVSIIPTEKKEVSTKNIHNALMAAGMTPAYGNVADVADATLYALEGEFGEAAWSMAAAIPVIGQMVSAKRALKVAKETGEEMVTLYRAVPKWFPGKMVKEGKFVGGESAILHVTTNKRLADMMISHHGKGILLEFEVPMSYFKKYAESASFGLKKQRNDYFFRGLDKGFLKKVQKVDNPKTEDLFYHP